MQSVNLDAEKFEQFVRCLSILRDICNDADIRGGILRQRTNDNTTVFEIDLRPYIDDMDIPLPTVKGKIDLFKMFNGQEVEISATTDAYSFTDQHTSLNFLKPNLDYLDNKYLPEDELESIFGTNPEDLLLSTDISETISERMKIVSQGFNVNTVQVSLNGDSAVISLSTQARDQHAKLASDISLERELTGESNLVVTPLTIDHDNDMEFQIYFAEDGDSNVAVNKYTTMIADSDVKIYSRSKIIESAGDEEDDE